MFRFDDISTWEPILETLNGRPGHRWPDGRWLPVIAGAEGEGGDGGQGGQGGNGGAGDGGKGGPGAGDGGKGGDGGGQGGASGATFTDEDGDKFGFPPGTPLVEMTEAQRSEYWRHKAKKHESRYKGLGDVDELKRKAGEFDKLEAGSKTEHDRAVEQARTEADTAARAEERQKAAVRLVDAEMKAAAAGRLEQEQLKKILEPLDRTKFVTDTGEVDEQKVVDFIASVAPANGGGKDGKGRFPALGQGRRGESGDGKPSVESGRDRYRARHGQAAKTQ